MLHAGIEAGLQSDSNAFGPPAYRPSFRANGSRECAPDDRLQEAIRSNKRSIGWLRRCAPRNDGGKRRDRPMFKKGLLAGKRILVTGGGSGLGAAMGRRFVELGAELIICGRRLALLEATAARLRDDLGGKVSAVQC